MSDKLGFTFYAKDWWTSDTYFELTPIQRYIYLECLFVMYSNGGAMKTQKTQFENRIRTQINDEDWNAVTDRLVLVDGLYTHPSVNKRLRKTTANRENGKKGGRPPKSELKKEENDGFEKPKKPKSETQNNPPLERESEREIESENKEEINSVPTPSVETANQFKSLTKLPWEQYSALDFETPKTDLMADVEFVGRMASNNVITEQKAIEWIGKFFSHIETTKEGHTNITGYRKHCANWINLKIANQQPSNNGKQNFKAGQRTSGRAPEGGYGKL